MMTTAPARKAGSVPARRLGNAHNIKVSVAVFEPVDTFAMGQ